MHLPFLPTPPLAFLNNMFGVDGLVVLIIGLLIFGRRLPEVGKNLGKTIVEFKKGLSGSSDDDKSDPPAAEEPAQKRLSSGSKVSVAPPSSGTRRRLPETEEV